MSAEASETSPFTISTRQEGTRFVVLCRGEVDVTTCDIFFAAVLPGIADAGTERVTIDMAEVTFLSASGLRILLLLLCASHYNGKQFDLRSTPPPVRRVLDLFGFTTFKAGLVWEATMSPRTSRS